jgi:hypothetical protein
VVGIAVTRNFVPQRPLPTGSTQEVCLLCQHLAKGNRVIHKSPSTRGDQASRDYQKVAPIAEDAAALMEKKQACGTEEKFQQRTRKYIKHI